MTDLCGEGAPPLNTHSACALHALARVSWKQLYKPRLSSPLAAEESEGPGKLSNLPKVTQLERPGVRIRTQSRPTSSDFARLFSATFPDLPHALPPHPHPSSSGNYSVSSLLGLRVGRCTASPVGLREGYLVPVKHHPAGPNLLKDPGEWSCSVHRDGPELGLGKDSSSLARALGHLRSSYDVPSAV